MNCDQIREHLVDYLYGELPDELSSEVEAELAKCPECAKTLEEMRQLHELVAAMPRLDVPAQVHNNIIREARLAAAPARADSTTAGAAWLKWLTSPAFATALVVCLVLGVGMLLREKGALQTTDEEQMSEAARVERTTLASGEEATQRPPEPTAVAAGEDERQPPPDEAVVAAATPEERGEGTGMAAAIAASAPAETTSRDGTREQADEPLQEPTALARVDEYARDRVATQEPDDPEGSPTSATAPPSQQSVVARLEAPEQEEERASRSRRRERSESEGGVTVPRSADLDTTARGVDRSDVSLEHQQAHLGAEAREEARESESDNRDIPAGRSADDDSENELSARESSDPSLGIEMFERAAVPEDTVAEISDDGPEGRWGYMDEAWAVTGEGDQPHSEPDADDFVAGVAAEPEESTGANLYTIDLTADGDQPTPPPAVAAAEPGEAEETTESEGPLAESDLDQLYNDGLVRYNDGSYREAIRYFQLFIQNAPRTNDLFALGNYYQGQARMNIGDYEGARTNFVQIDDAAFEHYVEAQLLLANSYEYSGELEEAEAIYNRLRDAADTETADAADEGIERIRVQRAQIEDESNRGYPNRSRARSGVEGAEEMAPAESMEKPAAY